MLAEAITKQYKALNKLEIEAGKLEEYQLEKEKTKLAELEAVYKALEEIKIETNDTSTEDPEIDALNRKVALLEKQLKLQKNNNNAQNSGGSGGGEGNNFYTNYI